MAYSTCNCISMFLGEAATVGNDAHPSPHFAPKGKVISADTAY